jgi:Ca2+-binding EF-hand superfamily protein
MMTNGVTSGGGFSAMGVWGGQRPDPAQMQAKFFAKVDANGDGGIDKTELTDAIDEMKKRSGSTAEVDVDALFSALDTAGDGSISQTELSENDRALFETLREQLGGPRHFGHHGGPPPAPPTQANADDLFAEMDSDEDGSISKDELTAAITAQFERATARYQSFLSESTTTQAVSVSA